MEHAALAGSVPDRRRTMAFASYATAGAVAVAFGSLSSGLAEVITRFGPTLVDAIRIMFIVYAAFGVLAAWLYLMLPPAPVRVAGEAPRAARLGPSRGLVYRLTALFALDSFASGFAVQSLITLWLIQRFGMSVTATGAFFFWTNIIAAASLPVAGWLGTRLGLINTMVWTHLPAGVLLILAALSPSLTLTLGLLLVRAVFNVMDTPARASYVMAIVTPEERAAAGSVTNAPRSLAAGISPAIAGILFTTFGAAVPIVVCGLLKVTYDVLLLAQFRNVRPPEEVERRSLGR
jgi:MFS family permease